MRWTWFDGGPKTLGFTRQLFIGDSGMNHTNQQLDFKLASQEGKEVITLQSHQYSRLTWRYELVH